MMKPINTKLRSINTKFWDDSYIIELTPIEKLVFLYMLTCPLTNLAGVYEISVRRISFDTGIEPAMIEKTLKKFESDRKMFYQDGFILIFNHLKNQSLNDNMMTNVKNTIINLPLSIKREYFNKVKPLKAFESLWKVEVEVEVESEIEGEGEKEVEVEPESEKEIFTPAPLTSNFDSPLLSYENIKPKSFNSEIDLRQSIETILNHSKINYVKGNVTTILKKIINPMYPFNNPEQSFKVFYDFSSTYLTKTTPEQKADGMKFFIGILKKKLNDEAIRLREKEYENKKRAEKEQALKDRKSFSTSKNSESAAWNGLLTGTLAKLEKGEPIN